MGLGAAPEKHGRAPWVDAMTTRPEAAARRLARHEGFHSVAGVTSLSLTAAESLAVQIDSALIFRQLDGPRNEFLMVNLGQMRRCVSPSPRMVAEPVTAPSHGHAVPDPRALSHARSPHRVLRPFFRVADHVGY